MGDINHVGAIDLCSSVTAVDLLEGFERPGSIGVPGSLSWELEHDRLMLMPRDDVHHLAVLPYVQTNNSIWYTTNPPYDDESLWAWSELLGGLLERFCQHDGVSAWVLMTDEAHVVSYWVDGEAAVVNSDIYPKPKSLREPLAYRSMELFERLGLNFEMRALGNLAL